MDNKTHSFDAVINSPIGKLGIKLQNNALSELQFLADDVAISINDSARSITQQIKSYFADANHRFKLAVSVSGTPFQQRVWKALSDIPSNTTLTYGELAKKLNSSPRAIGQACRKNPTPIVVPCHRVTGANSPGGYAGDQKGRLFKIKQWLLKHEGQLAIANQ